nr:YraN family protein [uncultured Cetobacterium sp.]
MDNRNKGHLYERKAKEYLEDQGVRVLELNYQGAVGEIDIIGYEGDTLVFFEVKYRKNSNYGMPIEAIDKKKLTKIYKTAKEFVVKNRLDREKIRFDALTFFGDEKIQWLKNILWGDEVGV